MNPQIPATRWDSGITLVEVMILMAILAMITGAVLLPSLARSQARGCRVSCVNSLKQVGTSYRLWAMDHGDKFPMSQPVTNGGTMDHPLFFRAWVHFWLMSNELATPKVLVCPEDPDRTAARGFDGNLRNQNVSYFVGVDADETQPWMLLTGDRNLTTNGVIIPPGLYTVNTNQQLGWGKTMHNKCGNVGLADGSVQQFTMTGLEQYLRNSPRTNRLAIP